MPKTDSTTAKYRPKQAKTVSDFVGQKFGHLTILSEAPRDPKRPNHQQALCKCECGNTVARMFTRILGGQITSCGCGLSHRKHGHAPDGKSSPTYIAWDCMIQRCTNPKNISFRNYGKKGVTIDPRWLHFLNFLADMGERPLSRTLDRKDNNLGYFKSNCRWATRSEQARNTSQNRYLTFKDQTLCVIEWAELIGIPHRIIRSRLCEGWSVERTLTTPHKPRLT